MMGIGSGLKSPNDPAFFKLITSGRPLKNIAFARPVATLGTITFVTSSLEPPRSFRSLDFVISCGGVLLGLRELNASPDSERSASTMSTARIFTAIFFI